MNKLFWVTPIAAITIMTACNNNAEKEKAAKAAIDSLMEQVMHGHDAGMGKMGRVEKAAQTLAHKIDSLQKKPHPDAALLATWKTAKTNLDVADSSMNRWMDSFDMDMPNMDNPAKIQYLQKNIQWVNGVADSLKTSLEKADSILKK